MRRRSFAILLAGTLVSAFSWLVALRLLNGHDPLPAGRLGALIRKPSSHGEPLALAGGLAALGLVGSAGLALRSEREGKRQQRRLQVLRRDAQTGLLSRLALEEDLSGPQPARAEAGENLLLAMVNLKLLARQGPFRREEDLQELFRLSAAAASDEGRSVPLRQVYRASEHRLALLLPSEGERDAARLAQIEARIRRALERSQGGILRADDLLVTGQRLRREASACARIELHGYGETLARASGRCVHLLEEQDAERVLQETTIRTALQSLDAADIRLEFQPILLLASPGQFGLEALLRFRTPPLQAESTGRLVAIAHELGITHRIDALVLRQLPQLLEELQRRPELDQRIAYIAFNLSGDSFATPQRLEELISSLRQLAIDPARFCLEFTETPSGDQPLDSTAVNSASERLSRELNLRIAIDDFGSGLSNYRRICEAWYDTLKLDIALVAGISHSFRMQRYVGSLIETVHALGKTVVCEGVEDHADFTAAVRLGADAIQGYLIARPMTWEQLPAFLERDVWASADWVSATVARIRSTDRAVLPPIETTNTGAAIPLERQILDNWHQLRSFEEFLLLFVNELKRWGLDILRLSLAFLPDQDDIDCSQYVWEPANANGIRSLRMDRAFLQQQEHRSSALHHIATQARFYRQRLASNRRAEFGFLEKLKQQGCTDYLGLRLDSRGISIPVLTIALQGESKFSDEQIQRIMSMSSLLSLLFYTFESERAKKLALLDSLTEIPNRRSFDSFFQANLTAARSDGTALCLALIDIDRFKQVNDNLGHAHGDACLRHVARILASGLRNEHEFAARLGGEEFALILPESSAEQARQLGEQLRLAVAGSPLSDAEGRILPPLTISIGIAAWDPADGAPTDGDAVLQLADDCLYEAKRLGRNRVVCRSITAEAVPG